ncbi:MAG TPA: Gfo/Idh/MocA family oxidoreductase [Bacilli bacterium]
MALKIGVVGLGQFSGSFIPLFQAHPLVDEVAVAEIVPERREEAVQKFGVSRTFASLEEMCESNVDAVAIFTQRHLHAKHTLTALKAGKHVYCAVPMAHSIEDVREILLEVTRTEKIYMTGETSYYYPSTIYCRDRFLRGDFGDFVYGEAQYLHDMSHGFYEAFQNSGGSDWKKVAGFPPMYYPSHSVSMLLSVTGARATHVSCLGFVDRSDDGVFRKGANLWDNPFSNQTALVRTSDGGMCRLNEFRRVGWGGQNGVYMSMFGTLGSFEEHAGSQIWTSINHGDVQDISEMLRFENTFEQKADEKLHYILQQDFQQGVSKVHKVNRLPKEFDGLVNGHAGSHQFLVDDFVKSVAMGKLPPNHAWNAAKYCVPGIISHESAKQGGIQMELPDFGTPPSGWDILDPEV